MEALITPPELERILIVDDHPFYAAGLAQVLRQQHQIPCTETVNSVQKAREELREESNTPDLILLDLRLPNEDGLGLFEYLRRTGMPIPVVVVSAREDSEAIHAARSAGAMGFLPKSCDRDSLAQMLASIARGDDYFPQLASLQELSVPSLTPRQQEVLQLLAQGYPNKRICCELNLTDHTVKTHLKSLYQLLDVHNRTECANKARAMGLVDISNSSAV